MHHSYLDEYSGLESPVHRLEPRLKIVTLFIFILFIILSKPTAYLSFFLYACVLLILLRLSKIPWRFVLSRSLVIIPFVLMIALFIPFLKKGEVAGGYSLGALRLTVTYDGLVVFWNVLIKAYLSILCVILLMASTTFTHFLRALEKLRIPKIFTMILSFMYRYVFVVNEELMQMQRAKEARSVGGTQWFHLKALANMLGVLFVRVYERGELVYMAMCARGFSGEIKGTDEFVISGFDVIFAGIVLAVLSAIKIFAG